MKYRPISEGEDSQQSTKVSGTLASDFGWQLVEQFKLLAPKIDRVTEAMQRTIVVSERKQQQYLLARERQEKTILGAMGAMMENLNSLLSANLTKNEPRERQNEANSQQPSITRATRHPVQRIHLFGSQPLNHSTEQQPQIIVPHKDKKTPLAKQNDGKYQHLLESMSKIEQESRACKERVSFLQKQINAITNRENECEQSVEQEKANQRRLTDLLSILAGEISNLGELQAEMAVAQTTEAKLNREKLQLIAVPQRTYEPLERRDTPEDSGTSGKKSISEAQELSESAFAVSNRQEQPVVTETFENKQHSEHEKAPSNQDEQTHKSKNRCESEELLDEIHELPKSGDPASIDKATFNNPSAQQPLSPPHVLKEGTKVQDHLRVQLVKIESPGRHSTWKEQYTVSPTRNSPKPLKIETVVNSMGSSRNHQTVHHSRTPHLKRTRKQGQQPSSPQRNREESPAKQPTLGYREKLLEYFWSKGVEPEQQLQKEEFIALLQPMVTSNLIQGFEESYLDEIWAELTNQGRTSNISAKAIADCIYKRYCLLQSTVRDLEGQAQSVQESTPDNVYLLSKYQTLLKSMKLPSRIKDGSKEVAPESRMKVIGGKQTISKTQQVTIKAESISFPSRMALVPFIEKDLVVDIQPIIAKQKLPLSLEQSQETISRWVAQVYDLLSRQTFNGYYSRHLAYSEARVYFAHNLALNFQYMIEALSKHSFLWREHKTEIIKHFESQSQKALEFMMIKYPLKKKTHINDDTKNLIPVKDETEDPRLDMISDTRLYFRYDSKRSPSDNRKSYCRNIKLFLNKIMQQCESQMPRFRSLSQDLFTLRKGEEAYQLKNSIGLKFKENTPQYTQQELDEEGVHIKAPEVLRVIMKWTEELEKKVRNLGTGVIIENMFPVRKGESAKKEYDTLNSRVKSKLKEDMTEKIDLLEAAGSEMRARIRSMLSLFPEYVSENINYFPYIHPNEVKSGLLSLVMSETVANLSVNYLTYIIHIIEEGFYQAREGLIGRYSLCKTNELTNEKLPAETLDYKDCELVSFTISDLLRCKCTGTLSEIKEVWDKLSKHDELEVYRVKNRLDTTNRDFLINAKMKGTPILCEFQLAVVDKQSADEKGEYLSHFSHFFYELARASYGPIAEAVIINSYLTDFSSYFGHALARRPYKRVPVKAELADGKLRISNGYKARGNNFTFICTHCLELRISTSRSLPNFDSSTSLLDFDQKAQKDSELREVICGDCVFSGLNNEMKSAYFLEELKLSDFFIPTERPEECEVICAVKRFSNDKRVQVLQKLKQDKRVCFLPVFYEYQKKRLEYKVQPLISEYYLFRLKNELNPTAMLPSDLYSRKNVVFASKAVGLDTLNADVQVDVITASDQTLVLNTHHTNMSLSALISKGREFRKFEIGMMKTSAFWKFQASNLDDSSFQIDMFKESINHVTEVRASGNCLTSLKFMSSQSVRILELPNNQIGRFQIGEQDFPNLQRLNLSSNKMTDIVSMKHRSLKELILAYNHVGKLPDPAKWQLPSLEILDLQSNSLEEADFSKHRCHRLVSIDLSNNKELTYLDLPSRMIFLQSLCLMNNHLSYLQLGHVNTPNLLILNVADNILQKIGLPKESERLRELYIQNNRLEQLPFQEDDRTALVKLSIGNNPLTELSESEQEYLRTGLDNIQSLQLGGNILRMLFQLQVVLHNLKELSIVELYDDISLPKVNRLSSLSIRQVRCLSSLSLCHVEIPRLQILCIGTNLSYEEDNLALPMIDLPTNIKNLTTLQIRRNPDLVMLGFREVQSPPLPCCAQFSLAFPRLQEIDISHNNINKVEFQEKCQVSLLKRLEISGNPLRDGLWLGCQVFPSLQYIGAADVSIKTVYRGEEPLIQGKKFPKLKEVLSRAQ